jgi:hypothetical protein
MNTMLDEAPKKETAAAKEGAEWTSDPQAISHKTQRTTTTEDRIDFDAFRGLLVPYLLAIGVELQRAGRDTLIGRCPIHQEKDGRAFAVYADGRWHCFGKCGSWGDVIDLDRALNGGKLPDAIKRIRAMSLGPPLPLSEYDDDRASEIVITSENPLGLPYSLSSKEREICANCAHRLAASNFWLSEISSWRGWKKETIRTLALEGSLGVDPAARICFNYESGLKFRYDDLDLCGDPNVPDKDRRIIKWWFGKPTLWRLGCLTLSRKVYLSEGETDAISLVDEGVEQEPGVSVIAVPCSTFCLAPLAPLFKDKEVVLVPDPDEAGLKARTKWVSALEPYAARLSYLNFISMELSPHGQE